MIEEIAIIGAGGFGREISLLIDTVNQRKLQYRTVGFFDDGIPKGTKVNGSEVLGRVEDLNFITKDLNVVIAIGNSQILKSIIQRLDNPHLKFPNIIFPGIIIEKGGNRIGRGNIITEGFLLTCNISIGNFNIFNTRVSIGHDVFIGNYNVFNPNTQISGEVKIDDANFFGVNSCVLQGLSIGNDNILGACSLLTRKIKDGKKYFGIPARILSE